jgi:hypothetical protein
MTNLLKPQLAIETIAGQGSIQNGDSTPAPGRPLRRPRSWPPHLSPARLGQGGFVIDARHPTGIQQARGRHRLPVHPSQQQPAARSLAQRLACKHAIEAETPPRAGLVRAVHIQLLCAHGWLHGPGVFDVSGHLHCLRRCRYAGGCWRGVGGRRRRSSRDPPRRAPSHGHHSSR